MPQITVVCKNQSSRHPTSSVTTWACGFPYEEPNDHAHYRVTGTSPFGGYIQGYLGAIEAPNAFGRPGYRPLTFSGLSLMPGQEVEIDLEVEPLGAIEGDTVVAAAEAAGTEAHLTGRELIPGFYFGKEIWAADKWKVWRHSPAETILHASGILPFGTGQDNAPVRGVCYLRFVQGSHIIEGSLHIQPSLGSYPEALADAHTPARIDVPMITMRTDRNAVPYIKWGIERGGGEVLPSEDGSLVVLQAPVTIGPGTPMHFEFSLVMTSHITDEDRVAWGNVTSGGCSVIPHRKHQIGAMPPFGLVGEDLGADAYELHIDDELQSRRAAVSRGTRYDVFDKPDRPLVGNVDPAGTGDQMDFGVTHSSLIYANGRGMPASLDALRWSVIWDSSRASHFRYIDGTCVDYRNHPNGLFWRQMPHYHSGVSPDRFGLREGQMPYQPGGLKGRDMQHFSINALVTDYLLTLTPWLRDCLEDEVATYLMERSAVYGKVTAGTDANRSWRGEDAMAKAYACTGDVRIPIRFAERVACYDRYDAWTARAIRDGHQTADFFLPMMQATDLDYEIVDVMWLAPGVGVGAQNIYKNVPLWETLLGCVGAVMQTRLIRESDIAVGIVGQTDLVRFERAVARVIGDRVSNGFIEGSPWRVVRAAKLPDKQSDGWPLGSFTMPYRYPDNRLGYWTETSVYASWSVQLCELLTSDQLGQVPVTQEAVDHAQALLDKNDAAWNASTSKDLLSSRARFTSGRTTE